MNDVTSQDSDGFSYQRDDADVTQVAGDRESFVLRPAVWAGGASDVGLRHSPNQDAIAMSAGLDTKGHQIAVACVSDGVSTSPNSEDASALAAETACGYLTDCLRQSHAVWDAGDALAQAFALAQDGIVEAAGTSLPGTWACTLVAAVYWHGVIAVGSLGDSRSYWVPDGGEPMALSTDDSMAQAQIDLGVTREIAESSSNAHAITKWLGPGASTVRPSVMSMAVTQTGWLVTCSDGLWNYASHPAAMSRVLHDAMSRASRTENPPPAWSICCELVAWANSQGGHDNITVTLMRLAPAPEYTDA